MNCKQNAQRSELDVIHDPHGEERADGVREPPEANVRMHGRARARSTRRSEKSGSFHGDVLVTVVLRTVANIVPFLVVEGPGIGQVLLGDGGGKHVCRATRGAKRGRAATGADAEPQMELAEPSWHWGKSQSTLSLSEPWLAPVAGTMRSGALHSQRAAKAAPFADEEPLEELDASPEQRGKTS